VRSSFFFSFIAAEFARQPVGIAVVAAHSTAAEGSRLFGV
jgi:hypothetical protein